ncbi:BON domain-containing protein [Streptomyces sp. DH24]|uniref:BON domain-containing protein n=1 Tax=Streptomyces sp. DH24 TaxID=3040123 RepID=UPI0024410942|nr:BON domain-containing protein [Streptomyces sp. DH24]MDG9719896.1 BON domain-containing protein [Streptomyces sp. DH24]
MTERGPEQASDAPAAQNLDYRVAHLHERFAQGPLGELGVRVEVHGDAVLISGTVPSVHCRDEIERVARQALSGHPVHCDLVVAEPSSPDHAEELA